MIEPLELIEAARYLVTPSVTTAPSDAQIRRSISTSYYAVFHTVARAAADRFLGANSQNLAAYSLIYRGFNHSRMKSVFRSIDVATLPEKLRLQLGRPFVSQHMRDFATIFVPLQEMRHKADYDPHTTFSHNDAIDMLADAETACEAFDQVAVDEKTDVMSLILAGGRD